MSGFSANAFFLSSREGHDYLNYFTMKLPVFIMESCNCDTFFFSFFFPFVPLLSVHVCSTPPVVRKPLVQRWTPGAFNVRSDPTAYCTDEGQLGTDECAQVCGGSLS